MNRKLRHLMTKNGFKSASDLAKAAGLSAPTVSEAVRGKVKRPNAGTIAKLHSVLGDEVRDCFDLSHSPQYDLNKTTADLLKSIEQQLFNIRRLLDEKL